MHTLIVERMSRQAVFTMFPHTAKKILCNRQQISKRHHREGRIPGLQEGEESPDLNSYLRCIVGIRRTCHKACEFAKEDDMNDDFLFILSDKAPTQEACL